MTRLHATRLRRHRQLWRSGLGMAELLIALAISAALLVAAAAAFSASTQAYKINQEQSLLMQQARIALHRIATTIRTNQAHAPEDSDLATQFAGGQTVLSNAIAMLDDSGNDLVFRYDADHQRLYAIVNGEQHVLCHGVIDFTVRMEPMRSPVSVKTGGAFDLLRSASIVLSIRTVEETTQNSETTGQQILTLSVGVSPRRNSW